MSNMEGMHRKKPHIIYSSISFRHVQCMIQHARSTNLPRQQSRSMCEKWSYFIPIHSCTAGIFFFLGPGWTSLQIPERPFGTIFGNFVRKLHSNFEIVLKLLKLGPTLIARTRSIQWMHQISCAVNVFGFNKFWTLRLWPKWRCRTWKMMCTNPKWCKNFWWTTSPTRGIN